jgi:hypothetical protein
MPAVALKRDRISGSGDASCQPASRQDLQRFGVEVAIALQILPDCPEAPVWGMIVGTPFLAAVLAIPFYILFTLLPFSGLIATLLIGPDRGLRPPSVSPERRARDFDTRETNRRQEQTIGRSRCSRTTTCTGNRNRPAVRPSGAAEGRDPHIPRSRSSFSSDVALPQMVRSRETNALRLAASDPPGTKQPPRALIRRPYGQRGHPHG